MSGPTVLPGAEAFAFPGGSGPDGRTGVLLIHGFTGNPMSMRPWGEYLVLEQTDRHWIKKLFVRGGEKISLQRHRDRSEVWVVLSGEITAIKGEAEIRCTAGDTVRIEKNEAHRIIAHTDAWILEAAFGAPREEDIVRLEDAYGRV